MEDISTQELIKHAELKENRVTKIDNVGDGTIYIGTAKPGTPTSQASWKIKRITEDGTITTIEWARKDSSYNSIWDNRSSLSYE